VFQYSTIVFGRAIGRSRCSKRTPNEGGFAPCRAFVELVQRLPLAARRARLHHDRHLCSVAQEVGVARSTPPARRGHGARAPRNIGEAPKPSMGSHRGEGRASAGDAGLRFGRAQRLVEQRVGGWRTNCLSPVSPGSPGGGLPPLRLAAHVDRHDEGLRDPHACSDLRGHGRRRVFIEHITIKHVDQPAGSLATQDLNDAL